MPPVEFEGVKVPLDYSSVENLRASVDQYKDELKEKSTEYANHLTQLMSKQVSQQVIFDFN